MNMKAPVRMIVLLTTLMSLRQATLGADTQEVISIEDSNNFALHETRFRLEGDNERHYVGGYLVDFDFQQVSASPCVKAVTIKGNRRGLISSLVPYAGCRAEVTAQMLSQKTRLLEGDYEVELQRTVGSHWYRGSIDQPLKNIVYYTYDHRDSSCNPTPILGLSNALTTSSFSSYRDCDDPIVVTTGLPMEYLTFSYAPVLNRRSSEIQAVFVNSTAYSWAPRPGNRRILLAVIEPTQRDQILILNEKTELKEVVSLGKNLSSSSTCDPSMAEISPVVLKSSYANQGLRGVNIRLPESCISHPSHAPAQSAFALSFVERLP